LVRRQLLDLGFAKAHWCESVVGEIGVASQIESVFATESRQSFDRVCDLGCVRSDAQLPRFVAQHHQVPGKILERLRFVLRAGGKFCNQVTHAELATEAEKARIALKFDLRNFAIVNLADGAAAHLPEIGVGVPVPGKGDTDEGRDEDHQDLVVFAHYGDHGL
jgi:hypothetical protein